MPENQINVGTKLTLSLSNFTKNNTPKALQLVGDILLTLSFLGGVVALAPLSAPVLATIGAWAAFAGAAGKLLTKFTGTEQLVPIK